MLTAKRATTVLFVAVVVELLLHYITHYAPAVNIGIARRKTDVVSIHR
jgi:hypothetical protein